MEENESNENFSYSSEEIGNVEKNCYTVNDGEI
jgi:hypothetical protein